MAELEKAEIVARIKQARTEAGLSQPEIADLLNVTLRTYQNYESNRVPYKLLGKIADGTGRSTRWLLHGEEEAEVSRQDLAAIRGELAELKAIVTALAAQMDVTADPADDAARAAEDAAGSDEGRPPESGEGSGDDAEEDQR